MTNSPGEIPRTPASFPSFELALIQISLERKDLRAAKGSGGTERSAHAQHEQGRYLDID
jgi:hypothetical protein